MYNEEEQRVADAAVEAYRKRKAEINRTVNILEGKRFKFGDIVIKRTKTHLDHVMGSTQEVGKIVGWDEHYEYYRVYYNKRNPFIGEREHNLEPYEGDDVPTEVRDYDAMKVKQIRVKGL